MNTHLKSTLDNLLFRASHETLFKKWKRWRLLSLTVLLPTTVSIVYFGFMASDVYVSESRFVVRSPEHQATSPLGLLFKGSGFNKSQDDSYTVQDYILSRDALNTIDQKIDIRSVFSKGDIFSRFPGVTWDDSFENLHRYYQKIVNVHLDTSSSIAVLTVRAFDAGEAQRINQHLLEISEALVNQLNERGRKDMIRFAATEVSLAEEKAKKAALALAAYRNQKGVIDPEKQSAIPLQQVAKLQDELISTRLQLSQLQFSARDNPQIPTLQKRIQTLETEIGRESTKITGGDASLVTKVADYQRLVLEREFADKQLASAMISLESARNEAGRQQLYLERIVRPSLPDAAMEPKRLRNILSTLLICLIIWGILTLLIAGIQEHHE